MSVAFYVIAILGCGEGNLPCEQVRVADIRFESREACQAATETQLSRFEDLQFPLVVAECRAHGAAPAAVLPDDVALPARDPRPDA